MPSLLNLLVDSAIRWLKFCATRDNEFVAATFVKMGDDITAMVRSSQDRRPHVIRIDVSR